MPFSILPCQVYRFLVQIWTTCMCALRCCCVVAANCFTSPIAFRQSCSIYHLHECLLLLLLHLVWCGGKEFYVRPSEGANVSCPGQPCLTMDQYSDLSANYLKSDNTVFTFLQGIHRMERPLQVVDAHNITLRGAIGVNLQLNNCHDPKCIDDNDADYRRSIICCSVVRMINVSNATISHFTLAVAIQNGSGITVKGSRGIFIEINYVWLETP